MAAAGWFSIRPRTLHATHRTGRRARCLAINPSGFTAAPARLILASEDIGLATDTQARIAMNAGGRSEQILAAAIAHHRAGRLADAERLYRIVCDTDPKNARAFHLLGVVAHQLRRPDAASLVGRAVVLDSDFAEAHNDRGVILAANGLLSDACSCFEPAVALNPGYGEAR